MAVTSPTTCPADTVAEPPVDAPTRWLFGRYDYPLSHRVIELLSFAAFCVLGAQVLRDVIDGLSAGATWSLAWTLPVGVLLGLALADLMSGIVHFLFDQLGSPDTPLIGQKFVKPFRDHHDDPRAMTRGDFVAVNSDNLLVSLPVLVVALTTGDLDRHPVAGAFVLALVAAVAMTNQIHKWAHMPQVPAPVRLAQRTGLILTVRHHAGHHRAPFDRHFCITFGRLDWLLDRCTQPFIERRRRQAEAGSRSNG